MAAFAIRRGGSTLLADMLASEQGVVMIDEPFLVQPDHPTRTFKSRWLERRRHSAYFDFSDAERDRAQAYMQDSPQQDSQSFAHL